MLLPPDMGLCERLSVAFPLLRLKGFRDGQSCWKSLGYFSGNSLQLLGRAQDTCESSLPSLVEEILGTNWAAGVELSTTCWRRVCCPPCAAPALVTPSHRGWQEPRAGPESPSEGSWCCSNSFGRRSAPTGSRLSWGGFPERSRAPALGLCVSGKLSPAKLCGHPWHHSLNWRFPLQHLWALCC